MRRSGPRRKVGKNAVEVEVEGRTLRLTNLDKVMYPKTGFTKGDLIDYYVRIAPVLLPHLHDRPLTLKRYPDGVEGQHFYEKQCPSHRPDWVQTAAVWSRHNKRNIDFCLANDLPTLVWPANLADIELHTSLSLAEAVDAADDDGVRPRSRAAGRHRRLLPGRPVAARPVRRSSSSSASRRPRARRGSRSTSR